MNQRVQKLRQQSIEIKPYISSERAELITDFYQSDIPSKLSVPVCRALAFKHLMENKIICINDGELIVGEKGPAPKATPTYPELCCHDLEDLRILSSRDKTRYDVSPQVFKVYEEKIIPFWSGKTIREKLFALMDEQWHKAFDAGVFTEFMEQRAPGHAIQDDKIYHKGLLGFKAEINKRKQQTNITPAQQQQYLAMEIVADAAIVFAQRHAELALKLAEKESNPKRKKELQTIAEVCNHVPANAPRNMHEALQMYWFIHLSVTTELNTWDSFDPGRLDQHLYPFYKKQIEEGTITKEQAKELLQCFWIKFNNQPAPPKVGVTEEQSGTYTDFALINTGGVKPSDGSDAVNELSYMILDVVKEMRLTQPSSCIQISKVNPDKFLQHACNVVKEGFGQPSIFNTDVIIQEMLNDGKTIADARAGGPSGCVTISAFGKESCTLTGYMNWGKILELTYNNGIDPESKIQVGPATGNPNEFDSFEDFIKAFEEQMRYFIDVKIKGNNAIERLFADYMPAPFMSLVMDDCIKKGIDYHNGGARYNPTYIMGVGMGSVADALTAIKYHIYDKKTFKMAELLEALKADFDGFEQMRNVLSNHTPKYGNDDEYADSIAKDIFEIYYRHLNGKPNTKGGKYRVNLLPTTVHIYFGSVVGALPSGRKAQMPLSDGISPEKGSDIKGPTAVLKSASVIDHSRTGGTLLNLKFTPQVLKNQSDIEKLSHLIRGYFSLGGHHVQFNVISADTLRQAQKQPRENQDLIVRVAGYSDYFVDIGRDLQDEIIARTEQSFS